MRLPQSTHRSLLVPLSISFSFLFVAFVPSNAGATTPQLQCSATVLRFGAVTVGHTETQLVTLTNTGQTSVTISAIGVSIAQFAVSRITLPAVLSAGQSVDLKVTFSPAAMGWVNAKILITSDASNPYLQLGVAGTGVNSESVIATPAILSFGKVPVGSSTSLSVVLTNALSSRHTLKSARVFGSGFSVTGLTFPLTLSAGQSVTMTVDFAPQAEGLIGGSIFLSGPGVNIPLSGTGTSSGQLTIAPSALNFGNIDIGNTKTQTATISATGGSVTISSAASNNAQFTVSGVSFPLTLNSGQSVNLYLVFSPTQGGTDSATLTVTSNASDTQAIESLTGNGITPQYSVALSWSPSTSSVVGYNVYRGIAVGAYSKINRSLDLGTAYTDNTVAAGMTYYYAATAVNASGEESSYSAPIQVVIP